MSIQGVRGLIWRVKGLHCSCPVSFKRMRAHHERRHCDWGHRSAGPTVAPASAIPPRMTQWGVKTRCEWTMHIQHQVSLAACPAQIGAFVILHAGARAIAGAPPPPSRARARARYCGTGVCGVALRGTPSRRGKDPLKSEPTGVIDPIFFFHGGGDFTLLGHTLND